MPVRHQVRLYDTGGNQVAVFDQWRGLTIHKRINTFGEHTFTLDKKVDDRWRLLANGTDYFLQLMRSDNTNSIVWYEEYFGFHRTPQHQLTEQGNRLFTGYGRSLEDILGRHSVAYQAGANIANPNHALPPTYQFTHKTGAADDVMKAYVRDNFGSGANNAYRLRDGSDISVIVPADASQAPQWEGDRPYRVVHDIIVEIGNAQGVDWEVRLATLKPPTFVFMTHYPLLGTDRTTQNPPILLSPNRQNVKTVSLTQSRTDEANIAIIVGKVDQYVPSNDPAHPGGVQSHRVVFTGTSAGAFDSPWNGIEVVRDSRADETALALSNVANAAYATLGAKESFIVTPLPNVYPLYGKDYFFGDKILVEFEGTTRIKKVVGVQITSGGDSEGGSGQMGESLTIELSDVTTQSDYIDALRNISSRIDTLEHQGSL